MKEFVVLPLFSEKGGINIPNKSGLNQWNADGRERDLNEVYIAIPIWIHRVFSDFFPNRDIPFNLTLPNGTNLSAKICQENGKALMSNPNSDLGEWILRTVLKLKRGELANYQTLINANTDSVIIYKEDDSHYSINYCVKGSYAHFKCSNK